MLFAVSFPVLEFSCDVVIRIAHSVTNAAASQIHIKGIAIPAVLFSTTFLVTAGMEFLFHHHDPLTAKHLNISTQK